MSNISTVPTLGEKRVRTDFNTSGFGAVENIKVKAAEFINLLEGYKNDFVSTYYDSPAPENAGEFLRLISLAQTKAEEAAMFGVKAVTVENFPHSS